MALQMRCQSKKTVPLGEHAEVDVQCGRVERHRIRHMVHHEVNGVRVTYSWPLTKDELEAAQ